MNLKRNKTKLESTHGQFCIFTLNAFQFFIVPGVKVAS